MNIRYVHDMGYLKENLLLRSCILCTVIDPCRLILTTHLAVKATGNPSPVSKNSSIGIRVIVDDVGSQLAFGVQLH